MTSITTDQPTPALPFVLRARRRSYTPFLALSAHLDDLGVQHAYIGGFAWALLGSFRPTQMSIPALYSLDDNIVSLREKVKHLDPRFADFQLKFFYVTAEDVNDGLAGEALVRRSDNNVHIDTLPAGKLGLPEAITSTMNVDDMGINILHPTILILTKLKRWSVSYTSTRPLTLRKVASDRDDIQYLVKWLADSQLQICFSGYIGKHKSELLVMLRKYRDKYIDDVEQMALLQRIMPDDWDDMISLPEPEAESNIPP
ncbi:hypothetical protein BC628DRAFT_43191, partial [Trametes gibbosa]